MHHPFSPEAYGAVLDRLQARYPLVSPARRPKHGAPCALLRHDVDIDPSLVPLLLEQEEARGLRSAVFYRIDAELYNIFDPRVRDGIQATIRRGHVIGLHYDAATTTTPELLHRARFMLRSTVKELRDTHVPIAAHRPTLANGDPFATHQANPYGTPGIVYTADSRRRPLVLPDPLPDRLLVNTHPEHYASQLPLHEHYSYLRLRHPTTLALEEEEQASRG